MNLSEKWIKRKLIKENFLKAFWVCTFSQKKEKEQRKQKNLTDRADSMHYIYIQQSMSCLIVRGLEILPQCENNHGSICSDAKHSNEEIQKTENYLYMAFKNQVLFWRTGFVHDKIFTLVHKKTVPYRLVSSPVSYYWMLRVTCWVSESSAQSNQIQRFRDLS